MRQRGSRSWIAVAAAGGGALIFLLMVALVLSQGAIMPAPNPAVPIPTSPSDPAVATVNGQPIGRNFWLETVLVDQVMSRLAGEPPPTPEESLEQLINQVLVLLATQPEDPPTDEEVEAQIAALEAALGLTDEQVVAALEEAGLGRGALERTIARLLLVQRGQEMLEAQGTSVEDWLEQERARAEIVIYQALTDVGDLTGAQAQMVGRAGPQVGGLAPDFAANTADGGLVTLSDYRGRTVLLTFCASWSEPCADELRFLQALWDRHRADGLEVLVVDVRDEPETARLLAQEAGYTRPLLLDPTGEVMEGLFRVQGLPTTLVLDGEGRVLSRVAGPLGREEVEGLLAGLLQPTPTPTPESPFGTAQDFTLLEAGGEDFTLSEQLSQGPVVLVFFQRCG